MTIIEIIGITLAIGFCLLLVSFLGEVHWWVVYAPDVEAAIITALSRVDKMKARNLRKSLEKQGYKIGLSRFYIVMARLVDDGCVEKWHEPHPEREELRVYWYKLLGGGKRKKARSPLKSGFKSLLPQPAM